jgi:hypothetical protein
MLRALLIGFGGLMMLGGAVLTFIGLSPPGIYLLCVGALILLGTLFERWRYRRYEPTPDERWQATGERFLDPTSGQSVEVFYDPASGERRYVRR